MIEICIDCAPVPWKAHAGYGRKSWNPRHAEKEYYQWKIKQQYKNNLPLDAPVVIVCVFYMPIPISTSRKNTERMLRGEIHHIKRPDTTNLFKFLEDTIKGIIIKDDSQVVQIKAEKLYSTNPRTELKIMVAG